jgi:hypothetical protein
MSGRAVGHWWVENLLRPTLIAGMLACLAAPVVLVFQWMFEGWDGTYFLVFAFFASLEGILSERLLQKKRIAGWGYLASRGAEALVLLVVLKLVNYIHLGLGQLWADALTWTAQPELLISNLDMLTGALFLSLWAGSLYVGRLASDLDVEAGKFAAPRDKTSTAYYLWLTQPSPVRDRQGRLDLLGEVFLWGGIVLLLASAAVHGLLSTIKTPAIPILLYFALGVALLSQARFSVTHIGWQVQGIPVQEGIGRRWLVWALVFLVGVALVALLLPTRYAMGPIRALLAVVNIVVQGVMLIVTTFFFLLVLLLSFIFPSIQPPERPPIPTQLFPPAEPGSTPSSTPWLQVLLSALFWIAVMAIVGYALFRFLQDRFGLFAKGEEGEGTWWNRFVAWWRRLWSEWRTWREGVQAAIVRRWAERQAERAVVQRLFRYVSLRRLPPREKVRFFYLSTAKRAAQAGQPRRPGQTPYEYQSTLDGRFPDLEPELMGLTEAFVEARYSHEPVQPEDAEAVKPLWQRIGAALRRKRAGSDPQPDARRG